MFPVEVQKENRRAQTIVIKTVGHINENIVTYRQPFSITRNINDTCVTCHQHWLWI